MEIILKALVIILVGMAVVFIFLQILIFAVEINYQILKKLGLDKEEPEDHSLRQTISDNKNNIAKIAAISAAIKMHEEKK